MTAKTMIITAIAAIIRKNLFKKVIKSTLITSLTVVVDLRKRVVTMATTVRILASLRRGQFYFNAV